MEERRLSAASSGPPSFVIPTSERSEQGGTCCIAGAEKKQVPRFAQNYKAKGT